MSADRCCHLCRSIPGVCALKRDCQCHEEADKRAEMSDWLTDAITASRESAAASKRMSDFAPWK